ncbi:MAG: helix-turn-helix transcriptional regulator, partial [Erysipelotrichaceae bacterium]|nr:helix-turn-helix transcriptional regulator [Erysipelotrichaceae bacterium]
MIIALELLENHDKHSDLTHWHDKIEVIRVLDHRIGITINGTDYQINQNDMCIINRGQIHRIYDIDQHDCTFQRLMIDPAIFTADKIIYQKYIVPLLTDVTFTHVLLKSAEEYTQELEQIMDEILSIGHSITDAYELKVIALVHMFFYYLYQYYMIAKKPQTGMNPDIILYRQMTEYIYQNYANKLSLNDIATAGSISKSKCCNVFKEYANHSPIDFLNLYRLKVSTDKLKNSIDSIASIAH